MYERKYQQLIVWQKSMILVKSIYEATNAFPIHEKYGIISQLRRSAISVPSNIAEGQGRLTKGEFKQFLGIARGSLFEIETQLLLASDLKYIPKNIADDIFSISSEVGKMLNGLINSINS